MLKKILVALGMVVVLEGMFALCLVSALQLLVVRDAPFGVTGASPVVNTVTSKVSLETLAYSDESAAMEAINQGKLYGAYIPGTTTDTLIVVPAVLGFETTKPDERGDRRHSVTICWAANALRVSVRSGG